MGQSTKPKYATSYKDTSFGSLPRSKVVELEKQGVKKALEYIVKLNEQNLKITPKIILDIHKEGFAFIFPKWAGKYRTIEVTVGDFIHLTHLGKIIYVATYMDLCTREIVGWHIFLPGTPKRLCWRHSSMPLKHWESFQRLCIPIKGVSIVPRKTSSFLPHLAYRFP